MDGKHLIKTCDDTFSTEDVALGHKQPLEVEAAFRTLKSSLDLRPTYHRVSGQIRVHVSVRRLALRPVRMAEIKASESPANAGSQLKRTCIVEIGTSDG